MKITKLVSAVLAATLGLSSLSSFAQGNDRRASNREEIIQQQQRQDDRRDDRRDRREDRRDDRYERRDERRDDRRDARHHRYQPHYYYYNARGPEFRRGAYIPREYRNRQYVVIDYRTHRLAPPPRGHQWVQVGSDYVLIAIATGLIASIILSR